MGDSHGARSSCCEHSSAAVVLSTHLHRGLQSPSKLQLDESGILLRHDAADGDALASLHCIFACFSRCADSWRSAVRYDYTGDALEQTAWRTDAVFAVEDWFCRSKGKLLRCGALVGTGSSILLPLCVSHRLRKMVVAALRQAILYVRCVRAVFHGTMVRKPALPGVPSRAPHRMCTRPRAPKCIMVAIRAECHGLGCF